LEHTDPVVELLRYAVDLVARKIPVSCKRRVVSAYFGDVGVFAVAEFRIVVTWLCIRWKSWRRLRTCGCERPVPSSDVCYRHPTAGHRSCRIA
jgi:hypothetical protein